MRLHSSSLWVVLAVVSTGAMQSWAAPSRPNFRIGGVDEDSLRFLRERKWDEAIVSLRRQEKLDSSPVVRMELSRALLYAGRREEAVSLLWRMHAQTRLSAEREAIRRRAQVVSRLFFTQSTFLIYQEGLHFLEARKLKLAQEQFTQALTKEPDNVEVLVRLAQTLLLSSDFDSASERLRVAKKMNPEDPEVRLWLGRALSLRGELEAALVELRAAATAMPDQEESTLWLAEALLNGGQKAQGISLMERHLQSHPMHLRILLLYAEHRYLLAGKDVAGLWAVRKELQLLNSRMADYASEKRSYPSDSLHLDLRDAAELKQQVDALTQKVDARFTVQAQTTNGS